MLEFTEKEYNGTRKGNCIFILKKEYPMNEELKEALSQPYAGPGSGKAAAWLIKKYGVDEVYESCKAKCS